MTDRKVVWVVDFQTSTYLDAQPLLATRNIDLFVLKPESPYLEGAALDLTRDYGAPHLIIQRDDQPKLDLSLIRNYPPPSFANAESFQDATGLITHLNAHFSTQWSSLDDKLRIDHNSNVINFGDITLHLTPRELTIFEMLYTSHQRVVARSEFLSKIWGETSVCNKVLDVHVSNLRKKIQKHGFQIRFQKPDSFLLLLPDTEK